MTDIFIFGTSHHYQCGDNTCTGLDISIFESELRNICTLNNIQRIAEEMTEHGRAHYSVQETIGARLARELKIEHHDVDLEDGEKELLSFSDTARITFGEVSDCLNLEDKFFSGMKILKHEVRERIWVTRICAYRTCREETYEIGKWPVLFICGADHVNSIAQIISFIGIDQKILHKDYKP